MAGRSGRAPARADRVGFVLQVCGPEPPNGECAIGCNGPDKALDRALAGDRAPVTRNNCGSFSICPLRLVEAAMDAGRTSPTRDTAGRKRGATVIAFPSPRRTSPDRLDAAVRVHGGELNGWFRRRTRNPDLAEDLGQEVWLRIARQPIGRIEDLRAYLFRTARTVLADFGREQGRRRDGGEPGEDIRDDTPDAERRLLDVEALDRLQAAVDALPPVQRQALIWARQEGLTLREIGKRLGVSESMACRYLNDALKTCQSSLARDADRYRNLRLMGSD